MPTIPTMSLKTAQFAPAVFTPTQYEYQAADMGILERSLAQREARMEKAVQAKSAVDKALGELELKLNPTEAKWFENYKQDIKDQIQSPIDAGDYGSAARNATSIAGNIFSDPRVLGRIRSQEKYNEELKTQQARRDSGEISQNTFDWWVNHKDNLYSYTDNTDANGNYVEGSLWQPKFRPTKDMDFAEQAVKAFKLITANKGTTNRAGGDRTTNADGTGGGDQWSNNQSYENITVEDVLANIEELLNTTPDGRRQAMQAYDVAKFDLERLQREYDSMSDNDPNKEIKRQQLDTYNGFMLKNGMPIDYKEYYARMITNNRYAHTLSYDWKVDDTSRHTVTDNYAGSLGHSSSSNPSGSQAEGDVREWDYNTGTWKAPNVEMDVDYDTKTLGNATSGITRRFNR